VQRGKAAVAAAIAMSRPREYLLHALPPDSIPGHRPTIIRRRARIESPRRIDPRRSFFAAGVRKWDIASFVDCRLSVICGCAPGHLFHGLEERGGQPQPLGAALPTHLLRQAAQAAAAA